jgi:hypothetical protein
MEVRGTGSECKGVFREATEEMKVDFEGED